MNHNLKLIITLAILALGANYVLAEPTTWVGPTAEPPGNNAEAPINVSSVAQIKSGPLGVGAFSVFGPGDARFYNAPTDADNTTIANSGNQGLSTWRLSVFGQATLKGGNPAENKVLAAVNNQGLATWKTLAELGGGGGGVEGSPASKIVIFEKPIDISNTAGPYTAPALVNLSQHLLPGDVVADAFIIRAGAWGDDSYINSSHPDDTVPRYLAGSVTAGAPADNNDAFVKAKNNSVLLGSTLFLGRDSKVELIGYVTPTTGGGGTIVSNVEKYTLLAEEMPTSSQPLTTCGAPGVIHGALNPVDFWQTRRINTKKWDENGVSINSATGEFSLPAGTYRIRASAPASAVLSHKARLYNVTDSLSIITGTSEYSAASYDVTTPSIIIGKFVIEEPKVFRIEHACTRRHDHGKASGFTGMNEIYTTVELYR